MKQNAIVIGGGPAGLSAAIGLSRVGLRVTLLEQRSSWKDRVCGSFLSSEASTHLEWLHVLDLVQDKSVPTQVASISCFGERIGLVPLGNGLAIPRKDLEEILQTQAVQSGTEIKKGVSVTRLEKTGPEFWNVYTQSEDQNEELQIQASRVVCANGRFSRFRNSFPLQKKSSWMGWNTSFHGVAQEKGILHLCFFKKGYVGTLTFQDGFSNVSGLISIDILKQYGKKLEELLKDLIKGDSVLKELLENATQVSPFQSVAALPFGQYIQENTSQYLVGDAAGVCDPFMGEGIARALSSGRLLFESYQEKNGGLSYFHLWNQYYSTRMKIGWVLRKMLQYPFFVYGFLKLLIHYKWFQKKLLFYMHQKI